MSYAFLFKYIIIGDTGMLCEKMSEDAQRGKISVYGPPGRSNLPIDFDGVVPVVCCEENSSMALRSRHLALVASSDHLVIAVLRGSGTV
mmetsp:Transcript_10780/g.24164  ORF Transcript_10780/g.24164 Transcript_10780/m.24164 type:complete len:89 (-) Transcript_10780:1106-1372(-)